MVYARLIIAGEDYGIQNFMTPLRSFEDHTPLAGITIGNIGPKIGFNTMDNGYLRFDHVRIPRTNMAMRFIHVDSKGQYHNKMSTPQLLYFSMLEMRAHMIPFCAIQLAKACTVAIRYSIVRQQGFKSSKDKAEHRVLDYQTQQYRLLPLLASSYALVLMGQRLVERLDRLNHQIQEGNTSELATMHAVTCGLKVLCSTIAVNGIEECRRACGGHGYLQSSGLPVRAGSSGFCCAANYVDAGYVWSGCSVGDRGRYSTVVKWVVGWVLRNEQVKTM